MMTNWHEVDWATPLPVPTAPPAEWFHTVPDWFDPQTALVAVDFDTGRVAALVAPFGEPLLDGSTETWTPPRSVTGYEFAHVGTAVCDDGTTVRIANIGGGVSHADPWQSHDVAAAHYANTATRRMYGRFTDTDDGIVFLGSMWPGSTVGDAFECTTSALSGDWRPISTLGGAYELVGAQLVNTPGLRPRPAVKVAAFQPVRHATASVFGTWQASNPAARAAAVLTRLAAAVTELHRRS